MTGQRSRSGLLTAAPTCGDEQGGSLGNNTLVAFLHFVSEEHFALIGRGAPCLVQCKVAGSGLDQVEDLFTLQSRRTEVTTAFRMPEIKVS